MIKTALAVMLFATTAQHLGLAEAVSGILDKIAGCHMCCSFWSTLVVLLLCGADVFTAAGLSMIMAYMSHWFALFLELMNRLYDRVWERIRRRKKAR